MAPIDVGGQATHADFRLLDAHSAWDNKGGLSEYCLGLVL